jgi:hypothetical protein
MPERSDSACPPLPKPEIRALKGRLCLCATHWLFWCNLLAFGAAVRLAQQPHQSVESPSCRVSLRWWERARERMRACVRVHVCVSTRASERACV